MLTVVKVISVDSSRFKICDIQNQDLDTHLIAGNENVRIALQGSGDQCCSI